MAVARRWLPRFSNDRDWPVCDVSVSDPKQSFAPGCGTVGAGQLVRIALARLSAEIAIWGFAALHAKIPA